MPDREVVAFVGLGAMGLPMSLRLVAGGHAVRGHDLALVRGRALDEAGGTMTTSPRSAAEGATLLVTMLPNADIVAEALYGPDGAAASLSAGALVIEMSSSAPLKTRQLGDRLRQAGVALIDAPVSGGVARAEKGTLAIMAGGPAADIERARPLLECMGSTILPTGPLGSGHAMKALNNYVSAAGLVAASEALVVGQAFGLAAETIVDVLNVSTGRNNSTETKLKPFVLSETFASGFTAGLMAKDIATAADLAADLDIDAKEIAVTAALWREAAAALGNEADHTEIYRFLARRSRRGELGAQASQTTKL